MINKFTGKYYFLSNFSDSKIEIEGMTFNNAEAAYHSFKNPKRSKEFQTLNPSAAKKLGRTIDLREDWEQIKDNIMYKVVLAKFSQNQDLAQKLIDTKDKELEEGNTWNDTYWGTCNGVGKNMLGRILMLVRKHLINERKIEAMMAEQLDVPKYKIVEEILTQTGTGELKKS